MCETLSGVPQGSVLGPLLFLLFINDLPTHINSECRLFADDALVYSTKKSLAILQQDLVKLAEWSNLWQLKFNPSKCSVLSIGELNSKQPFYLDNVQLTNVNSHPYLGIELHSSLRWDGHILKLKEKKY